MPNKNAKFVISEAHKWTKTNFFGDSAPNPAKELIAFYLTLYGSY